ncbi:MAG: PAS domain-containing protein [Clostridiales bacterium]|nr:ATP-binding protein [uncultured Anaerotignum sp.]MBS6173009.1 PAS domain-containing protein [Clostridiales bacterium]
MTKRIFRAIFNVSLLILIASTLILVAFVGDYNSDQTKEAMHADAVYIAKAMETEGISYLEQLPKQSQRITWIDADGTVLFDSYADVSQMENHGEREEVVEALKTGRGESTRYSTTLAEKTENYAIKLSDGTILRLSVTSLSALSIFLSMTQPLALVLVIALILAGFLASKTSKSIVKPLENVDLKHPEQAEIYDEMAPFLRRIAVQNKLISKQMQDRQRRQREFETITENMQEGLLVLDAKGEVLSCNKGARRLLGVDHVPEKENVFALNRTEGFRRCITAALAGNHEEVTMESDSRSYQLLANPVTEDGLVAGVVLLLFDNTEKADREKLRREFTANVSHELKTPLTSISGFAEIMKNGMVKAEDVPRFANNIYDEAQRLISMVQDIIQLSRLDEAQETMEKTEVNVALIAETVAKRLEGQAAQRNIVFHIETESAVLSGVPHVLEEMIYNLCDNAIRYNKDNGSVTLKVEKHPDDITVTVADTGIGIPYGEQERVFERFYRVSRSRSKEIDGTGLGLSIVKHGALLHQATVKMESEVDKGTTIRLIFPNK